MTVMKKRILFVHHVAVLGGGSFCMLNLVRNLNREEYEPYVLLGETGPLMQELEKEGVPVFILPEMASLPYNKPIYKIGCLQSYARQPRSLKAFDGFLASHPEFDIVYLNNMFLCPYLKLAKKHGRKALIHIREHWPRHAHPVQFSIIRNMIGRWADRVIAINEYSASIIPGLGDRVHIVYDGIDMSGRYENMPYDSIFGYDCSGLKVFLYIGGYTPIKGISEIVEVFHGIQRDDYRLLIVGDRLEKDMRPGMRRTCDIIDSDSRIKCIPSTYRIEHLVRQAYCTVSFFTWPHANLFLAESIICRTPAIAARTEESEEYSDNGLLAFLCPFKDKKALREAFLKPEAEYVALRKRVEESSAAIASKFDKNRNVKMWHDAVAGL